MGAFFYEKESTQHVWVVSMAVQKRYTLITISSVQAADIPPTKKLARKVPNLLSFFWLLFLAVGTWVGWWWWFFFSIRKQAHKMLRWALDGCSRDRLID
jgi:hypothetical protein